uniref:PIG-L deacetylase family protein n=1 Tax=Orrella sp. TaxID=1921583 RepID=UPI00404706F9
MPEISEGDGWSQSKVSDRKSEIDTVRVGLGVDERNFYSLGFSAGQLDTVPLWQLVNSIAHVFKDFLPEEVLLPYPGDVHSDHRVTFDAASACCKWFRYPSVLSVLAYETISETDFGLNPQGIGFKPNLHIDITPHIEKKLELLRVYQSELGDFPFPRSIEAVRALASIRGTQSGYQYAESFMLLRQRY